MARLVVTGVLIFTLTMAAFDAEAAMRGHHRRPGRLLGPGVGIVPYDNGLIDNGGLGYGATYGTGGIATGEIFTRNSGGVNSMNNNFGTSGVLGHTNGMPVTGRY